MASNNRERLIDVEEAEDEERLLDLEEEAEGVDFYRTPGSHLMSDEARDQAEASGWIPPEAEPGMISPLGRARARRHDLREAMEYVEFVVAGPSSAPRWAETVEAALLRLTGALSRHIEETEAPDGLLAQILETAPHLGAEVREIEAEHGELVPAMDRALQALEGTPPLPPAQVRRRVMALLGRITLHRQRGSDLVYTAYNVDIGAGD